MSEKTKLLKMKIAKEMRDREPTQRRRCLWIMKITRERERESKMTGMTKWRGRERFRSLCLQWHNGEGESIRF
ncbi:hypothetical protein ACLOJK_007882 [Asimina triloba]